MNENELVLVTTDGKKFTLVMPPGATFGDLREVAERILNHSQFAWKREVTK